MNRIFSSPRVFSILIERFKLVFVVQNAKSELNDFRYLSKVKPVVFQKLDK